MKGRAIYITAKEIDAINDASRHHCSDIEGAGEEYVKDISEDIRLLENVVRKFYRTKKVVVWQKQNQ